MITKIKTLFIMCVLSAIALVIMPVQQSRAAEGDVHSVTYNLTGASASPQEETVTEGSGLDMVLTPNDGYELPGEISVTMGGEEISSYIYESGNLIIAEVYGDIVITVSAVPVSDSGEEAGDSDTSYNISYDLYEVTASKREGNVMAGTRYSVKLKANSGFRLDPLNVAVKVNGDYVTNGYSFNENLLEIDSVNGDVVIEAIAVQKASSKNNNKTNKTDKNTSNDKTSEKKNNTSSSKSNNSKSEQALSNSGGSAQNYSNSSYRAPKTGDDNIDIRYYGALALIFIGAGLILVEKKQEKD